MTAKRNATILDQLWPPDGSSPLSVYVILDGARDDRIAPAVRGSKLPESCLYAGDLPSELASVAPYLAKLQRDHPFTGMVLEEGWGKSWGIFVLSTADLEELRRHFRRFLKVQDEKGKTLIFRYYDPRVLRVYLPTCNARELLALFGPASLFVLEGEDPSTMIRYHREADKLGIADVPLV